MRGYYVEPAVHVLPRAFAHDLILFARYEKYNTQQGCPRATCRCGNSTGRSWVTGRHVQTEPRRGGEVRLRRQSQRSAVVPGVNGINLGIGWWF